MEPHQQRAREIQRQIGAILLRSWDPIGISDEPGASDEYEAYVGGVYRLLASAASASHIAEHLARIEAEQLGFPNTDPQRLIPVAEELRRLDVQVRPPTVP